MSDDFHRTLERLREARDEIEREFDARLSGLDEKVREAREALEHAATLAGAPPLTTEDSASVGAAASEPVEPVPWPAAGGERGGLLDRLAARLLRGHLATLDRRHRQLAAAIESTEARTRERIETVGERLAEMEPGATVARVESVRELAGRATEAAELAALGLRRMKELLNAKEAETVHVATHGARAQAELTLTELARQQEALLSELVGRRQQLDRLLEGLEGADDAEGSADD